MPTSLRDSPIFPHFFNQVPRDISRVFLLQISPPPVLSGDHLAASRGSAPALHLIRIIISGCPVVSEFFAGFDVSHRDKNNLTFNADIRFARVVAEDHAAFAFRLGERPDEEILGDLYFGGTERFGDSVESFAVEDVATLDAND